MFRSKKRAHLKRHPPWTHRGTFIFSKTCKDFVRSARQELFGGQVSTRLILAGPRQRSGRTVRSTWRGIFTVRLLNTSELGILTAHPNGLDRIYQNRDFTRRSEERRVGK